MANKQGLKWNKGGKLSRKQMLSIDFSAFEDLAEKLDKIGADLPKVIGNAMEEVGVEVQADTLAALDNANLPAEGTYSRGDTAASVIDDVNIKKSGSVLEINLGFDKRKPGAGGFLITGTPKMQPDQALADIYSNKKYERQVANAIKKALQKELERLGG